MTRVYLPAGLKPKEPWPVWLHVIWIWALLIACYVFAAYQESKTYNRITGAKTTCWDAMWVELRVQDSPQ